MWTEEQILAMDKYLWLDYSIECIWVFYIRLYQGQQVLTLEQEDQVTMMMDMVYDLESKVIDLIDTNVITFSMIDKYREMYDVPHWPARFG